VLQDSRSAARRTPSGDLVLLADQDRSRWDAPAIDEGTALVERALRRRQPGPYQLQAAIAAVHAQATAAEDTDWLQIVVLYSELAVHSPSPVILLNRAVAVAMASGPEAGLALVDAIEGLDRFHLMHAARADLLHRLGRTDEAIAAYERALELAGEESDRRFLTGRLTQLGHR
jgi:predicted RNA polymerase sigma factor